MTTNLKEREQSKTYIKLNALTGQKLIPSGGFRGGRAGRAPPPLKFAKHMLYNVN